MASHHESEWIYSTVLTKKLKLTEINEAIHSIPSVPHPIELCVFVCGYAFNPVVFPLWLGMIHFLTQINKQNAILPEKMTDTFAQKWQGFLQSLTVSDASLINTVYYLVSVIVTLIFTELAKASCATTRPITSKIAISNENGNAPSKISSKWVRRYGSLVQSLKSKHSFPSGDCAQAMNLCIFLYRHIPISEPALRDGLMFAVFLPGVAFARVFYCCHWIEDTVGGIILAFSLHWLLIPFLGDKLIEITTGHML